eukprot:3156350-Amphidinium_carterae.1
MLRFEETPEWPNHVYIMMSIVGLLVAVVLGSLQWMVEVRTLREEIPDTVWFYPKQVVLLLQIR